MSNSFRDRLAARAMNRQRQSIVTALRRQNMPSMDRDTALTDLTSPEASQRRPAQYVDHGGHGELVAGRPAVYTFGGWENVNKR